MYYLLRNGRLLAAVFSVALHLCLQCGDMAIRTTYNILYFKLVIYITIYLQLALKFFLYRLFYGT